MKVRWTGESGAVNRDVGAETGTGDVLENGATFVVSKELGESLVSSHVAWESLDPKKPADEKSEGKE